ncbi:MAG: hypothetical protein ACI8TF_001021 [Paracoccaceae bacterium]|jgi:hypothetical protein
MPCAHLDQIILKLPNEASKTDAACAECVPIGNTWVRLRMCRRCGHFGRCDSSPHRHARAHFEASGHPVLTSFEMDQRWSWCFGDEAVVDKRGALGA